MGFKSLKQAFKTAGLGLLLLVQGELAGHSGQIDPLQLAQAGAPVYYFASREQISTSEIAVTWGVEENGKYVAIRYNLFLTQDRGIGGVRVTLADGTEVDLDEVAGINLSGIDEHPGDVETLWKIWRRLGSGKAEEVGIVIKRHDEYIVYLPGKAEDVVVSERKHAQFLALDECLGSYRGGIAGIRISTEYCDDQGLVYRAEMTEANRWDEVSRWSAATGLLAEMFEIADRGEGKWCVHPKGSERVCRAVLAPLPADVWDELLPDPALTVSR